jgi:solute carrier family 10 (sodium/bile acid cotransporter), member 7
MPAEDLRWSAGLVAVTHGVFLAAAFYASGWRVFAMTRSERVAATICATQKTAALGLPMLAIIFAGDPALPILTLPLLMNHILQLVVASLLAPAWRSWAERASAGAHAA